MKQEGWFELSLLERKGNRISRTICGYVPRIYSDKTKTKLEEWMEGNTVPGRDFWCDYCVVDHKLPGFEASRRRAK